MFPFLLLSVIGTAVAQQCGVELPQQKSCAVVETDDDYGYYQAQFACQYLGGKLLSIHNAFANAALVEYAKTVTSSDVIYLGADNYQYNSTLQWIDGTPMNFTNWATGEPSPIGSPQCLVVRLSDGRWLVQDCQSNLPYACEITVGCDEGEHFFNGQCYGVNFFPDQTFTWDQAHTRCVSFGAELVSIHSQPENDFILTLVKSHPNIQSPWIGLSYNAAIYSWTDGSPVTYRNSIVIPATGPSDFWMVVSGTEAGQWAPRDSGFGSSNSFVCKRSPEHSTERLSKKNKNIRKTKKNIRFQL